MIDPDLPTVVHRRKPRRLASRELDNMRHSLCLPGPHRRDIPQRCNSFTEKSLSPIGYELSDVKRASFRSEKPREPWPSNSNKVPLGDSSNSTEVIECQPRVSRGWEGKFLSGRPLSVFKDESVDIENAVSGGDMCWENKSLEAESAVKLADKACRDGSSKYEHISNIPNCYDAVSSTMQTSPSDQHKLAFDDNPQTIDGSELNNSDVYTATLSTYVHVPGVDSTVVINTPRNIVTLNNCSAKGIPVDRQCDGGINIEREDISESNFDLTSHFPQNDDTIKDNDVTIIKSENRTSNDVFTQHEDSKIMHVCTRKSDSISTKDVSVENVTISNSRKLRACTTGDRHKPSQLMFRTDSVDQGFLDVNSECSPISEDGGTDFSVSGKSFNAECQTRIRSLSCRDNDSTSHVGNTNQHSDSEPVTSSSDQCIDRKSEPTVTNASDNHIEARGSVVRSSTSSKDEFFSCVSNLTSSRSVSSDVTDDLEDYSAFAHDLSGYLDSGNVARADMFQAALTSSTCNLDSCDVDTAEPMSQQMAC